jgi:DnaK suppressor protein
VEPDRARELLRRERERIERSLAELRRPLDTDEVSGGEHLGDQATELYTEELEAGQREQLLRELEAVERAERRLDDGTYGLSVESGEPIPDERLEAIPTAERTAAEQAHFERRR